MNFDLNTVPDTMPKSEDFLCSSKFKTAPIGGLNEHSVDSSVVINVPRDPEGNELVCIWGLPQSMSLYAAQGIRPVPAKCFKDDSFNSGRPMRATSPSVSFPPGGGVFRDSMSVMLFWTTQANYQRMMANNTEAARRAKGGKSSHFSQQQEEIDAYGQSHGIPHFTQDVLVKDGERVPEMQPGFIPSHKSDRVSLSGKKKAGSKVGKTKFS